MEMERHTRVYPARRSGRDFVSGILLFLSAAILFSGLVWREKGEEVGVRAIATATPIPIDAAFDETPAEKEMALPGSTWYALQLGAFEKEEAARELAEQYARRGAAGYVWHDGRYRTLAAVYPTKEDAQQVRSQLTSQHSIDTYLYAIHLPPVRIRLSGMRGQLDILEAAFLHGNDLAVRLQELCVSLDRQEQTPEEAVKALRALGEQMETVSLRLRQRFSPPRHSVVEGMDACLTDYVAFCTALSGQESAAQLSAMVKRQSLSTLDLLKKVYDSLSHT